MRVIDTVIVVAAILTQFRYVVLKHGSFDLAEVLHVRALSVSVKKAMTPTLLIEKLALYCG